jgi:hypothetical protein
MTHFLRIPPFTAGRTGFSTADAMIRLVKGLILPAILFANLGGLHASAAPILASATRTTAFSSTSTTSVTVPLRNDGTKSLKFTTTVANQTVVITYNAECLVTAARGTWLSIKVLVDGTEANPSSGTDFALCSAVDTTGQTWSSAVRQSVLKVPQSGDHTVVISARLLAGSGYWWLDDSSLVIQRAMAAFATRESDFQSAAFAPTDLPLLQNGAKELSFNTSIPNERLKITYNAECVLAAANSGTRVTTTIHVDSPNGFSRGLCNAVDSTGKTWTGAAQQVALTIPFAGAHTVGVTGQVILGEGKWRVDDSSLVITKGFLASAVNNFGFLSSSTVEVPVPILSNGDTSLEFTTAQDNQQVKLTYNAQCVIYANRGSWLGLRIDVDGVEAAPASGFDFALCSALGPKETPNSVKLRQSVIIIPKAGVHHVQVLARGSDIADWELGPGSLVVE